MTPVQIIAFGTPGALGATALLAALMSSAPPRPPPVLEPPPAVVKSARIIPLTKPPPKIVDRVAVEPDVTVLVKMPRPPIAPSPLPAREEFASMPPEPEKTTTKAEATPVHDVRVRLGGHRIALNHGRRWRCIYARR